jgi:hypothetical protein
VRLPPDIGPCQPVPGCAGWGWGIKSFDDRELFDFATVVDARNTEGYERSGKDDRALSTSFPVSRETGDFSEKSTETVGKFAILRMTS